MAKLIALVLLTALRLHAATQTDDPTDAPTPAPIDAPTGAPTIAPTGAPTAAPTDASTDAPTGAPTEAPTGAPTETPTDAPTGAPTPAPECSGVVFLNSSLEGECALQLRVDASRCGFEVTPDYEILDDHLQFYNCSHVVNPSRTGFEILCVYPDPPPFARRRLQEDADRRLGFLVDGNLPFPVYPDSSDDQNAVLTWTARRPAYAEECNATIVNLTQRIEELEEELASCQTTATTTQTATAATSTTVTRTTSAHAPAVAVASAGAGGNCVSYLPFLIASLALNGLLILLLACQHLRGKRGAAPDRQAASPPAVPVWEWSAERAGTLLSEVRFDHQAGAVSRGTNPSSSAPSEEEVGGVRSGGQQSSNTWAGRSIVYRYLRRGSRSGNEIQASSRRGWRMNAQEPPNMDDPQSATTSRAPSDAASRDAKTVTFARSGGGSPGSGAAGSGGARGSADPEPPRLAEEEYQV